LSTEARGKVQRPFAIGMVFLSIVLIYSGFRVFMAGLNDYQAMLFQVDWEKSNQQPRHKAWLVARDAALSANEWQPYVEKGVYLERLGRIYDWQYTSRPFGDVIAATSRDRSLQTLRQAIAARPTWPYNYVALAFVKLKQLSFDDEFAMAFAKGHHYGPWRKYTQIPLAELSVIAWPSLSNEQKEQARINMNRAFQLGAGKKLHNHIQTSGVQREICAEVTEKYERLSILCEKVK